MLNILFERLALDVGFTRFSLFADGCFVCECPGNICSGDFVTDQRQQGVFDALKAFERGTGTRIFHELAPGEDKRGILPDEVSGRLVHNQLYELASERKIGAAWVTTKQEEVMLKMGVQQLDEALEGFFDNLAVFLAQSDQFQTA